VGLWDPVTGTETREVLPPQSYGIQRLVVSPDGSRVLVAMWLPPNAVDAGFRPGEEPVAFLASLTGAGDPVPLRLPLSRSTESSGRPEYVTAAAFSQDGATVDVGTSTGRVVRFDTATGDVDWDVVAHHGSVLELVLDEQTGQLVTTGDDSQAVVVDTRTHHVVRKVASSSSLLAALPSADGNSLALYSDDGGLGTVTLDDQELVDQVRSEVLRAPTPDECGLYGLGTGC
jgi:WD40 repeat protein